MELLFIGLALFILYALMSLYFNLPSVVGSRLEKSIHKKLKKYAIKNGAFEFHDLMFKDGDYTSQIDNVLITRKAIYVIEAKNYKGQIFGSYHQNQWTVTVKHVNTYKSKSGRRYHKTHISKHQFYNPIKQNQTHLNKIKKVISIKDNVPLVNVVVFGSRAYLKNVEFGDHYKVISVHELIDIIKLNEIGLEDALSYDDIADLIDTVHFYNITDKKEKKRHVQSIKDTHYTN